MDAFVDGVLERHGRVDLFVNNAGGQFLSPAEAITPKGFRTVIELNVQGTWQMTHAAATKAFIPQGGRQGGQRHALAAQRDARAWSTPGAARAAVENMMRTLSVEWARFGIRLVRGRGRAVRHRDPADEVPEAGRRDGPRTIPLGRLGEPEEMAWLIAYLASPAGDFFSGA